MDAQDTMCNPKSRGGGGGASLSQTHKCERKFGRGRPGHEGTVRCRHTEELKAEQSFL